MERLIILKLHRACQTMEHENQGMICNTACPNVASRVLKALNTAKLLIVMQVLSG
jgi:hypothetical protein